MHMYLGAGLPTGQCTGQQIGLPIFISSGAMLACAFGANGSSTKMAFLLVGLGELSVVQCFRTVQHYALNLLQGLICLTILGFSLDLTLHTTVNVEKSSFSFWTLEGYTFFFVYLRIILHCPWFLGCYSQYSSSF